MTVIAKRKIEKTRSEYRESAPIPFDLDGMDDLYVDIAEIINENFVLEVEASIAEVPKRGR